MQAEDLVDAVGTTKRFPLKKAYSKPRLLRYGTVRQLTLSGAKGGNMDAQWPGGAMTTKSGF